MQRFTSRIGRRREILDAAWDAAHETSIAGLTLREIRWRHLTPRVMSMFADDSRCALGTRPVSPSMSC